MLWGFQGISDDDFSRAATAQTFSVAPSLDPAGSSWLPLPFWLNGAVMALFGPSWAVARGLAVVLGIVSVWLVWLAANWLVQDRRSALVAAAIVAVLPWSLRLGVSPVPELPTAALSLLALASLAEGGSALPPGVSSSAPRRRLWGAAALLVGSLCRYEPWFLSAGFVAVTAFESVRARKVTAANVVACGIVCLAPLAWMAWNQHVYGDPLRFLHLVTSYKDAIDHGATLQRATAYLYAALRAEPELLALAGVLALRAPRAQLSALAARFAKPALVGLFLFLTLTASNLKGGAPTHHDERAVLVIILGLGVWVGALLVATHEGRPGGLGRPFHVAAFGTVLFAVGFALRSWVLYREAYAQRETELAIGAEVKRRVPPNDKVLVEVLDYGFYAVEVGAERPWSFVESRQVSLDGRVEYVAFDELAAQASKAAATHIIAYDRGPVAAAELLVCQGPWCLYRLR